MKNTIITFIIGYIVLTYYFNGIALTSSNQLITLFLVMLFFPIAFIVAKLSSVNGWKGLGVRFHKGWHVNLMIGFSIGFVFWVLLYYLLVLTNVIHITSLKEPSFILLLVGEVFLTFFLGSFINDIIVRGYVFGTLQGKFKIKWVFLISVLLYALDDIWYAGFSFHNTVFSIILGLSLTYAFYKTGSIWANTGIHWGLNVCYGLVYGSVGKPNGGIFLMTEDATSIWSDIIPLLIPASMFLFVFIFYNFYRVKKDDNPYL
ncbi:hypothetical protein HNQ94_002981 [Salirhabdus euzebyi]|uniref:CAAX prenyl protease 2/Lysostaphin resistance protein A-like domain-containing protein n=1 Tax=Salirhabdus euzebyi TaxID=394506 RepID=A0A841Q7F5_9BACI|nr:type II CAAX endopeptidase family protein [Salirhabdus euzebyi]MBB6454499.1 hypothetical protein [Salirhabdus euzebyi]